jgi:hypothetical protein
MDTLPYAKSTSRVRIFSFLTSRCPACRFELLINVKRLFPAIKVIAMSGSFSGSEVPHGILADGFYAKGGSVSALLQTLRSLPRMKQRIVETAASLQSPVLLAYEQR